MIPYWVAITAPVALYTRSEPSWVTPKSEYADPVIVPLLLLPAVAEVTTNLILLTVPPSVVRAPLAREVSTPDTYLKSFKVLG